MRGQEIAYTADEAKHVALFAASIDAKNGVDNSEFETHLVNLARQVEGEFYRTEKMREPHEFTFKR